jgi:hypothetical protein
LAEDTSHSLQIFKDEFARDMTPVIVNNK